MTPDRLCVFCEHFRLDMGHGAWSEWTPGHNAEIECGKDHWSMKQEDGADIYRAHIIRAASCPDYKQATP